jgi:hypothetical protein
MKPTLKKQLALLRASTSRLREQNKALLAHIAKLEASPRERRVDVATAAAAAGIAARRRLPPTTSSCERARMGWGEPLPDWILALAEACDQEGQSAVARKLEVSPALVNQTLANRYLGRLDRIELKVRKALR